MFGIILVVVKLVVEDCGLFLGVWNVVLGEGFECGVVIVLYLYVCKVVFIGSVCVGKEISYIVVDWLILLIFELGGKLLNIIFEDVDFVQVIFGVICGFIVNVG